MGSAPTRRCARARRSTPGSAPYSPERTEDAIAILTALGTPAPHPPALVLAAEPPGSSRAFARRARPPRRRPPSCSRRSARPPHRPLPDGVPEDSRVASARTSVSACSPRKKPSRRGRASTRSGAARPVAGPEWRSPGCCATRGVQLPLLGRVERWAARAEHRAARAPRLTSRRAGRDRRHARVSTARSTSAALERRADAVLGGRVRNARLPLRDAGTRLANVS